ncbi:hypothetical protein CPB83DRAFT_850555 [Crepidotus variabilis]|uniref:Hemerythrin-like domain-containing protein n=1 Tax=Crepidotus variabilis TaxID=179855 RepID=A0A9P6JRA7_9AGAR|nr:hypothetical protein CPB83DRAFT_850555 [Crepidotus variabilis]
MQLNPDHEGPFPLILSDPTIATTDFTDPFKFAQWYWQDLMLTHNVIIRALNAIWLNAALVLSEDEQAFVGYALATVSMIRWHHGTQETVVFPRLQSKIDMRKNMAEHLKIDKKMKEFEEHLQRVQDGAKVFDMAEILELRNSFGVPLVEHFHNEIESFRPKSLYRCSQLELTDLYTALENHKHGLRDSAHIYPFLLSAHNREVAPNWPVVPASVRWVAQHVGPYVHGHYWKFAPYTTQGQFQTYPMHEHHAL